MKISKHMYRNAGVTLAGLGLSLSAGLASAGPGGTGQWMTQIPEPSVISLMAGGTAAIIILARLKRKK